MVLSAQNSRALQQICKLFYNALCLSIGPYNVTIQVCRFLNAVNCEFMIIAVELLIFFLIS
jgi:hypothetical protein